MTDIRELTARELDVVAGGEKTAFPYVAPGANQKNGNAWTDWIYDNYKIVVAKADRYAF